MGVACSSKEPADQTASATEQNHPAAERTEKRPIAVAYENLPAIEPNTVAENMPQPNNNLSLLQFIR